MNIPPDKIRTVMNDTKLAPDTGIAGGSRLHYYTGLATLDAAKQLMEAMKKPDGTYRGYEEMITDGIPTRYTGVAASAPGHTYLDVNRGEGDPYHEVIYSLFMSEVEVDVNTGKTKVLKMTCVGDIGVVGNLLGAEGQVYGGMSHSLGLATKTDFKDMKKHSTMVGAGITECEDMPDDMDVMWHVTYRESGPHGSAGCSEAFQSSGHMSIINAINDAIGVRIYELPASPEKIKAGLEAKEQDKDLKPEKYYLGPDMHDDLDYLEKHPAYWDFEKSSS